MAAGCVITFYSYKGGTGRTMALANSACLLAAALEGSAEVLVIDWDLEAPGLHRYLPPRLRPREVDGDVGLDRTPGLIDYFIALERALPAEDAVSPEASDRAAAAALDAVPLADYVAETEIANLRIVRAGRNDDGLYAQRVNGFDWERLFRRAPSLYRLFAERLAERYRYVLVDSRTGVTDISGICTTLLPERLVVVFTPNQQSLSGVGQLVHQATRYRRGSDDLRPLLVYPLPSRIEASLQQLRERWRFGHRDSGLRGYQPMFQDLLRDAYGLAECDLGPYFDEVQIQQTPDYAYGEEIAVRRSGDRFALATSYQVFVDHVVSGQPPWTQAPDAAAKTAPVTLADAPAAVAAQPESPALAPAPATGESVAAPPVPPRGPAPPPRGPGRLVHLSYASEDRLRVAPFAQALQARGLEVAFEVELPAGAQWRTVITQSLDRADLVVVFWSQTSVASQWVLTEAEEGQRRGVLLPVLLDNAHIPLGYRELQAFDARRATRAEREQLADLAAQRLARGAEGGRGVPLAAAASRRRTALVGVAAALVVGAGGWLLWPAARRSADDTPAVAAPAPVPAPTAAAWAAYPMPGFVGSRTETVRNVADALMLEVRMRDNRSGEEAAFLEGVVTAQEPAADAPVRRGDVVTLTVETTAVAVPDVLNSNLSTALERVTRAGFVLGKTTTVVVKQGTAGRIVSQTPRPGTRAARGSAIDVEVTALPAPTLRTLPPPAPPPAPRPMPQSSSR